MNKLFLLLITFFIVGNACKAQRLSTAERKEFQVKEDSMKSFALELIRGRTAEDRFNADSQFTKMFVRALKLKNSFYFPFDSLITISRLSPKDSSFKIYTWQLVVNDDVVRKHGAIQMRTENGSLKLFPLIDKTEAIKNIQDTIANNLDWVGAVYYKIIENNAFGKKFYTLLGYDENNLNSNRKIIEVLTFQNGQPLFGGSFFSFQDNGTNQTAMARYIMEYKKNASPRLTYDANMDMIIYEHLISETGEPNKKYTYIPDGDYEGLKWRDGKWVHIQKVFNQMTPEGKEPVPNPIRDAKGTIDESKLSQRLPENADDIEESNESTPVQKMPTKKTKKKG
jgi:hypothetical protein